MKWILFFYLIFAVYAVYDFKKTSGVVAHEYWKASIAYLIIFFVGPFAIIFSWFLQAKDAFSRWE